MTKLLNILVFLFILGSNLARSSGIPDSPYQYWDENGLSRNPIRELYRRNTARGQTGESRRSRNESPSQKGKQENPIRFGWEIYDKLRNSPGPGTEAPQRQPSDNQVRNQQGHEQGEKRGEFVSNDPKYMLQDTSSYQQAIKSLQEILKGYQIEASSPPTNIVYSKGKADSRTRLSRKKRKPEKKSGRGSRNEKAYLDYTNSMMPFNEGTKLSGKEQEKESEPETGDSKKDEGSDYARVRRYLDQGRVRNMIKGLTTLEAKEAAMSRVLDPNLNLDGILEPHVRKRRYALRKKANLNDEFPNTV